MSSTETLNLAEGKLLQPHSAHPATLFAEASNSIFDGMPRWSAAALPRILRVALASDARSTREALARSFLGKLTCLAQAHTTRRLTRSKAFARSRTKATSPKSSSHARYFNLSTFPKLSAEFLHFAHGEASHSIRYLCCHFATSGALKASHQRTTVGMSAIGISLVTFFGIKNNIVVHACCGHFSTVFHFFKNSTTSSVVSLVKSKGTFGWKQSHPLLSLPCTISTLSPVRILLALVGLPPISSIPHFSKSCPQCSARFRHIANALSILSSLLHSGPKA